MDSHWSEFSTKNKTATFAQALKEAQDPELMSHGPAPEKFEKSAKRSRPVEEDEDEDEEKRKKERRASEPIAKKPKAEKKPRRKSEKVEIREPEITTAFFLSLDKQSLFY